MEPKLCTLVCSQNSHQLEHSYPISCPATLSSSKLMAPLADRTNGQAQPDMGALGAISELTPAQPGSLWSKASQQKKASLDRFFATGKHSDSDDEAASTMSKAVVKSKFVMCHSLTPDRAVSPDEDLPDLLHEPSVPSIPKTEAVARKRLLVTPKSEALDAAAMPQRPYAKSSTKRCGEADIGESKFCTSFKIKASPAVANANLGITHQKWLPADNAKDAIPRCCPKIKALGAGTSNKAALLSPFLGAKEVVHTSINPKETATFGTDDVPHSDTCERANGVRAIPLWLPKASTPQAHERLFSSPKSEALVVSALMSPFLGVEEVVHTSISPKETANSLKRCTKTDAVPQSVTCEWTNGAHAAPPWLPKASTPQARKRLFASPKSEPSGVSALMPPILGTEVAHTSINPKETANCLQRCTKTDAVPQSGTCKWTNDSHPAPPWLPKASTPQARKRLFASPKSEASGVSALVPPLLGAEEVAHTSINPKETANCLQRCTKTDAVPQSGTCKWTNDSHPAPPWLPKASTPQARKRLFASPKSEASGVSALVPPLLGAEEVAHTSINPKETANCLQRCTKTDAMPHSATFGWTNGVRAAPGTEKKFVNPKSEPLAAPAPRSPCFDAAEPPLGDAMCENPQPCVKGEATSDWTHGCGAVTSTARSHHNWKRTRWEMSALDSEEGDEPTFPHCAVHVAEEALFATWYRVFVKRRRQAAKVWSECSECKALHSAYKLPMSTPESGQPSTSGAEPATTSEPCPPPASDPEPPSTPAPHEVIIITDSDDDTVVIESSDDCSVSPRKPQENAKCRWAAYGPGEVICISDDDTVDLSPSFENDEAEAGTPAAVKGRLDAKTPDFDAVPSIDKFEALNFAGALATPKKKPAASSCKEGAPTSPAPASALGVSPKRDTFQFLRSPKSEPKATGRQVRTPRGKRNRSTAGNYTPTKNGLITRYFLASPKSEGAETPGHVLGPKKPRPDVMDPIPKRELFQRPVDAIPNREPFQRPVDSMKLAELQTIEEDSGDEFEAPRKIARGKPQPSSPGATVGNMNHNIEQLVNHCLEAKGPHLPLGMQLIHDCCTVEPSHGLVARLLATWCGAEQASEAQLCHWALANLHRRHQVLCRHDLWSCFCKITSVLQTSSDLVQLEVNCRLAEFLTRAMEDDLEWTLAGCREGTTAARARATLVYKWLDPVTESSNIRALQQWMASAVIRNHSGDVAGRLSLFLSCLSQLLEMAVRICTDRRACCRSMAKGFCSVYAQLPLWGHRRALVDLMQPALLQSVFVATLLEERASRANVHEGCTRMYLACELSIDKILNYFFLMGPLALDPDASVPPLHVEEDFEEMLFLQFHLLRAHLEAVGETASSSQKNVMCGTRAALLGLETRCYRDCPNLLQNVPFQKTLVCLALLFS